MAHGARQAVWGEEASSGPVLYGEAEVGNIGMKKYEEMPPCEAFRARSSSEKPGDESGGNPQVQI